MNETQRKCAHEACTCTVPPQQKFCSTSCEQAAAASQTHSHACNCGHDACAGHDEDAA
jgi:hypothetical protein